jgi:hypothetical protein
MIICIECTARTKDELDELLRVGGYRDYGEAVALAVSNQLLLHRTPVAGRTPAVGTAVSEDPDGAKSGTKQPQVSKVVGSEHHGPDTDMEIPALFRALASEAPRSTVAGLPADVFTRGQRITIDRWIFGQHNKVLPLKASVRALANLILGERGGVLLSRASTEISAGCEILGAYLRKLDGDLGLMREDSLSTAFPSATSDINKSRLRFSNQFVGAVNKHGQLRGFPIDLKLVNYKNPKDPKLLLTEAGWKFASLTNPILDHTEGTPITGDKLSEEERGFLIQHIRDNVPVEDFAIRAVLSALDAGASNPDDLDAALRAYMPERTDEPFSPAFLSTQRAGAISRMSDLRLVAREREGLRVTYIASELGKQYSECVTAE